MSSSETTERLFKLTQTIEEAKARHHEARGALANLKAQLKEQFGLDSVDDAKALIAKLDKGIEELERKIDDRLAKLEKLVRGE